MTRITVKAVRVQWTPDSIGIAFAIVQERAGVLQWRETAVASRRSSSSSGRSRRGIGNVVARGRVGRAVVVLDADVRDGSRNGGRTANANADAGVDSTGRRAPHTPRRNAGTAVLIRQGHAGIAIETVTTDTARDTIGVARQVKRGVAGIRADIADCCCGSRRRIADRSAGRQQQ